MGFRYEHPSIRVSCEDAADRGACLSRYLSPVALVLPLAWSDILAVDNTGDALHVDRDQYPQLIAPVTGRRCDLTGQASPV